MAADKTFRGNASQFYAALKKHLPADLFPPEL